MPEGEEVMWFGMQVIVSCATTWVSYVATGPLQNSTHNLRFPLIICLIFLTTPVVLEGCRASLSVFKRDKLRWTEKELVKEQEGKSVTLKTTIKRTFPEKDVRTPISEVCVDIE